MNVRYDPTVTMGNIITVAVLTAGMLIAWFKMEGRVAALEIQTESNRQMLIRQADILNRIEINNARTSTLMEIYGEAITNLQK